MRFFTLFQEQSLRFWLAIQPQRIVNQAQPFQSRSVTRRALTCLSATLFVLLALAGVGTHPAWSNAFRPAKAAMAVINVPADQPTITAAVAAALNGDTISVSAGTYTEAVTVNKSLTLTGIGMPTVTAPAGANQTIFNITAANVTIQGFKIVVNRPNAAAGIAAIEPAAFTGSQILNNLIQSAGAGSTFASGCCGNTSAAGIALVGNGGIVETATIKGNTINSSDGTSFFGRAIWLREMQATVGGPMVADGNTLIGLAQDLLLGFSTGGPTLVQNNTFNGAGLDSTEVFMGPLNILNNTFAPGSPLFPQSCLIKHGYNGVAVNVNNNVFTGHTTGVWSGGSGNVTIDNNTFTPATGLAAFQNIRIDTLWPGTIGAPFNSNSAALTNNTLNGAAGSTGDGILFKNGLAVSTTDPDFSSVTLGGNKFNASLTEFMRLDGTAAQQFTNNLNGTAEMFDVGSGLKLPSAMTPAELIALENKVFHKLDLGTVGLVTFVANNIFVSSTGASGSTPTPSDNDYTRINNAVQAAPSGTRSPSTAPITGRSRMRRPVGRWAATAWPPQWTISAFIRPSIATTSRSRRPAWARQRFRGRAICRRSILKACSSSTAATTRTGRSPTFASSTSTMPLACSTALAARTLSTARRF